MTNQMCKWQFSAERVSKDVYNPCISKPKLGCGKAFDTETLTNSVRGVTIHTLLMIFKTEILNIKLLVLKLVSHQTIYQDKKKSADIYRQKNRPILSPILFYSFFCENR